ncbi:MAG TPA: hypothetical protein VF818_01765 [Ktedonobacterales bacterium]
MTRLEDLSVDAVAHRCAEEMARFRGHEPNDPACCFELFRRALADGSQDALTRVYQIYEPQVRSWVYGHSRFAQANESADFFAHAAMSAFYFAVRGPRFARFATLPQVLTYLKVCVHSAIAQHLRDHESAPTISLQAAGDPGDMPHLEAEVEMAELWEYICRLLPDERDRILAHCAFVQDLKPRQIVRAYPGYWSHVRDVSIALYRIRRILRTDLDLQQLSGRVSEARARGAQGNQTTRSHGA